jgi:serine/threonine-protein kinase
MIDAARLVEAGNSTMASIWHELDPYAAAGEAKELTNLGIAHGWAGVLYATLRWSSCSGLPLPTDLEERLHQLATHAEPTGRGVRWPWVIDAHARSSAPYAMPGWCNGSAGFVFLWTLAHRTFGDATYLMLAEKSAWNAWEEIENGASLCCGLAGRAYALLNLYKHTGERAWLLRAQTFANRAALVGNGAEALGNSLYKGELGVALLAADLLQPATASMPFFEEENW